ncbi:M15 family metallopeptidase [Roseomonas sp. HF4]|uniref:M15 family metallopeptidase n=1 Tax=Roseomonas sp. HF4 TaxID=2562313 RepID=UPI0010C0B3FB|nr:M15 family metallopeptidase [Roseomonas sp. HF4]
MSALLPRDRARLEGVHRDLVRVVERARPAVPFIVTEGLRSRERQARLVAIGASRTMNSRHLTGHAVDLAYWRDDGDGAVEQGEIRWDWPLYEQIGAAMKAAAKELVVPIVWGGDWASFRDGPHFELDRKAYP